MRKLFFAISALSTLLGAERFHVEPRKTSFLKKALYPMKVFNFNSTPKFSHFVNIVLLIF